MEISIVLRVSEAITLPTWKLNVLALALNCSSKAAAIPPTAEIVRTEVAVYFKIFFLKKLSKLYLTKDTKEKENAKAKEETKKEDKKEEVAKSSDNFIYFLYI